MKQIQDASAGCHHFESDGMPAKITNNQVSAEARQYTRKLGMEIMGKPELQVKMFKKRPANTSQVEISDF